MQLEILQFCMEILTIWNKHASFVSLYNAMNQIGNATFSCGFKILDVCATQYGVAYLNFMILTTVDSAC